MSFAPTAEQQEIRAAVPAVHARGAARGVDGQLRDREQVEIVHGERLDRTGTGSRQALQPLEPDRHECLRM